MGSTEIGCDVWHLNWMKWYTPGHQAMGKSLFWAGKSCHTKKNLQCSWNDANSYCLPPLYLVTKAIFKLCSLLHLVWSDRVWVIMSHWSLLLVLTSSSEAEKVATIFRFHFESNFTMFQQFLLIIVLFFESQHFQLKEKFGSPSCMLIDNSVRHHASK